MKKPLLVTVLFMACLPFVHAQCNNPYFPLNKGAVFEWTTFNKKDEAETRAVNTIKAVEDNSQGRRATVHTVLYDKKDQMLYEGDYEILCDHGSVKIDMESMFKNMLGAVQPGSEMPDMQIEVGGYFLVIPPSLAVGDALPDSKGSITMKMAGSDMAINHTDLQMTNCQVTAKEDLTTPAGTFACFKVHQKVNLDMQVMMLEKTMSTSGEVWIAEGVGMVRSDHYDTEGQLQSYTLLTSYQ